MATRGYIGLLDANMEITFFYNHSDSYPSGLLKEILENILDEDFHYLDDKEYTFSIWQNDFYELIEKAKQGELVRFNDFDDDTSLFIEYIYIIGEKERCIYCFENAEFSGKYYYKLFTIIPENLFETFESKLIDFLEEKLIEKGYSYYRDAVMDIFRSVDFREIGENELKDKILAEVI